MTDESKDTIGELSDTLDNLLHAAKLPLPPQMHLTQLTAHIEQARDILRRVYYVETGENPWGDEVDLTDGDDDNI